MKKILLAFLLLSFSSLAFADFQKQVGTFTYNTGGTSITVTTGFQPKGLIMWTAGKTTGTESALATWCVGMSDGTHNAYTGWVSDDAVATTNTAEGILTSNALRVYTGGNPATGTGSQITTVAFNSTNFVLTQNANAGSAWIVNYIAFGGSDITNVFVGTLGTANTTGIQHITTPGFQGNMLFTMGTLSASLSGSVVQSGNAFGAATSSTNRWVFGSITQDAQTVAGNVHARTVFQNTKAFALLFTDASQIVAADFSAFTATGFDYNVSTASATAWQFGFMDIQGGQWDVGSGVKPTTATTQTVTGEAFRPSLMGVFTSSPTAANSITAVQETSFGATDGTNQVQGNAVELDSINTVAKSSFSNTSILLDRDGTNNPLATFTSFNSDGWTITWNATGSAREVGWFTAAASSAPPATVPTLPAVY